MGPDLSSHFVRYSHEFVTTMIVKVGEIKTKCFGYKDQTIVKEAK
jgi:hypothetical protein